MTQTNSHSPRAGWLAAGGLALLTLLVYAQCVTFDFINFDDTDYVRENRMVLEGLSLDGVRWAFSTSHAANWHPLTWLSLMADVSLFGTGPAGLHATNVALHTANVLLLFWLLSAATGALGPSAFVAAIFAVHPLHAESVAWIVERKDVLSTFFGLFALGAYGRYVRGRSWTWYGALLVCYAFSLMAKQMLVTLPILLLLLDYWPLQRIRPGTNRRGGGWRPLLVEKIPLVLLAAGASVTVFLVQQRGGAVAQLTEVSLGDRLANAIYSCFMYVYATFLPIHLAFFYPRPRTGYEWFVIAGAVVLLAGISVWAVRERERRPFLLTGWGWYLVALLPVIGLIQIGDQARADRYTYVPQIGLLVMLAWGAESIPIAPIRQMLRWFAPVLVLAAAVLGWFQVATWRDSRSLAEQALSATKENAKALQMMGDLYLADKDHQRALEYFQMAASIEPDRETVHSYLGLALDGLGDYAASLAEFRIAAQLAPHSPRVLNFLAQSLDKQGLTADAILQYRRILEIDPDSVAGHNNLALALWKQKDSQGALQHFRQAQAIAPNDFDVLFNLATVLDELGQTAEALDLSKRAVDVRQDSSKARTQLGTLLAKTGQMQPAIAEFKAAIASQPDNADAHANLGRAYLSVHALNDAIAAYEAALQIDPKHHAALNDLAWVRATASDTYRDRAVAVQLAERLAQVEAMSVEILDTLAAAYAADGQFERAADTAAKAITEAQNKGQLDLARQIQERRDLYISGKSFRDPSLP
jgi:tetratricopeptide (TPR) repeat protein